MLGENQLYLLNSRPSSLVEAGEIKDLDGLVEQLKKPGQRRLLSHLGTFDVVMCRNVLIYFDNETRKEILERQVKTLAPDGYLFLGGGERTLGITEALRRLQTPEGIVYCDAATDPECVDLTLA